MKGIVFTEFLELVESKWGADMVDDLIESNDLESGGIYTAVGTYDFSEMQKLLGTLSEKTGIPASTLLETYGNYFSGHMTSNYIQFFEKAPNCFAFLSSIHDYIHVEVKKLYPDAELPHFASNMIDDNTLELIYTSSRKMGHFAKGLIHSSIEYYKEDIELEMNPLDDSGSKVRFLLTKNG